MPCGAGDREFGEDSEVEVDSPHVLVGRRWDVIALMVRSGTDVWKMQPRFVKMLEYPFHLVDVMGTL